ncbi:hypothetical protein HN709_05180 [Candidatus Peregrinibacteria bacterium]|jgi:hypothetical protein|nr:hypothetical protein [Candidatus Peregrinibacteria bacterium]MBT7737054.1 hypothetical protein [Candidatus Peregrinibacteria bacterium]
MGEVAENGSTAEVSPEVLEHIGAEERQLMAEWIKFPKVTVTKETKSYIEVEFDGVSYKFTKAPESSYSSGGGMGMSLGLAMAQVQIQLRALFQKKDVRQEFMEVMCFHELRERHHASQRVEDPHQAAVHDEILYAIKYLESELLKEYFEFAEGVRAKEKPKRRLDLDQLIEALEKAGIEDVAKNDGFNRGENSIRWAGCDDPEDRILGKIYFGGERVWLELYGPHKQKSFGLAVFRNVREDQKERIAALNEGEGGVRFRMNKTKPTISRIRITLDNSSQEALNECIRKIIEAAKIIMSECASNYSKEVRAEVDRKLYGGR